MKKTLGVGIIGASPDRGWAKISHVPAVQTLAGLELVAVASGSQLKADEAAKTFGARHGYADGKKLILDPGVDIVTIAVKVPDHRELVLAALGAGKHIYCEWPLGRNLAETQELAAATRAAKVHAMDWPTNSSESRHASCPRIAIVGGNRSSTCGSCLFEHRGFWAKGGGRNEICRRPCERCHPNQRFRALTPWTLP